MLVLTLPETNKTILSIRLFPSSVFCFPSTFPRDLHHLSIYREDIEATLRFSPPLEDSKREVSTFAAAVSDPSSVYSGKRAEVDARSKSRDECRISGSERQRLPAQELHGLPDHDDPSLEGWSFRPQVALQRLRNPVQEEQKNDSGVEEGDDRQPR